MQRCCSFAMSSRQVYQRADDLSHAAAVVLEKLKAERKRRCQDEMVLPPIGENPWTKARITSPNPYSLAPEKGYVVEIANKLPVITLVEVLNKELRLEPGGTVTLHSQDSELAYDKSLDKQKCIVYPSRTSKSRGWDWVDLSIRSESFNVNVMPGRLRRAVDEFILRGWSADWCEFIPRHFFDEFKKFDIDIVSLSGDLLVNASVRDSDTIYDFRKQIAEMIGVVTVKLIYDDSELRDEQYAQQLGLSDGAVITALTSYAACEKEKPPPMVLRTPPAPTCDVALRRR